MKTVTKLINEIQDRKNLTNNQLAKKLKLKPNYFATIKYCGCFIGEKMAKTLSKLMPKSKQAKFLKAVENSNKTVLKIAANRRVASKKSSKRAA